MWLATRPAPAQNTVENAALRSDGELSLGLMQDLARKYPTVKEILKGGLANDRSALEISIEAAWPVWNPLRIYIYTHRNPVNKKALKEALKRIGIP